MVEFADDPTTPIEVVTMENHTVRVKALGLKEYQLINGKIDTYNMEWINCGQYQNKEEDE